VSVESLPTDKLIGQVLANRYQILHRLGEGAMGVVYKARHVKVGRSFAVKVLHSRLLQDGKVALRFDREAELAGRLRHANVVGVVDVGEVDGMRYMVMDFAEGPDLSRLLVEAPMPPERIIHVVRQLLEGLYHAHEQGLIHRDFKPENVIIERDAHGAELPRIVDFGIAILRDGSEPSNGQGRLTTNGLVLGTPHYMAPEQAVADPIDHRIDLFALGIVIYEMLSGRLPFDGSGAEVARANLLIDPPAISERVPYLEVDPLLEAFARRLMSKKPSARPATAKAARELLDLIDRDRPAAAAALGMPSLSGYAPAVTQSVAPQVRELPSPQTTRLRATPSPSQPVVPPGRDLLPAIQTATTPIPTVAPPAQAAGEPPAPVPGLPPGPIAFSGPRGPVPSFAVPPGADHETAIQTPLGWPVATRRRTPLLIAGVGLVAILAGLLITRSSTKPDAPAVAERGMVNPGGTNPADPSTTPRPAATEPPVPTPAPVHVEPPAPRTAEPQVADVEPIAAKADEPKAPKPATKPPAAHEPRTKEPEVAAVAPVAPAAPASGGIDDKPRDAHPADAKAVTPQVPAPRAHETSPASPKPPEIKANANAGITPQAVAALYSAALAKINLLPSDASQDLMTRWRHYNVQGLMLAPQAERDQAAEQLSKIREEAVERLSKSRKDK